MKHIDWTKKRIKDDTQPLKGRRKLRAELRASWLMVPSTHPLSAEEIDAAFKAAREHGITAETAGKPRLTMDELQQTILAKEWDAENDRKARERRNAKE